MPARPTTTTIDKGNGEFETDLVSHITTKDSDGKPTTITTTIPLKPSDAGEADYTTTIISDGHTITEVVSHVTTTDSDGKTITYITTMASYDQVDEGVFTSPAPYSQPPVVTSTVTEDDGSSKTVVISYFPSEGEDGVTRTGTTTVSTITPGEADYTTTIDKGNGEFETDLVSHITTKDSDGKPTTITTTIPLKPSDAGEADYTTTIDKGNGEFETDLVSHITKDSDGKPTTITTTIPLKPSDAGEADYTTTIDKGNGEFETDLVSHITTKDSDGKPTTITTTIPLKPSDAGEADYTTTIISDGHTITEVVSHVTTTDSDGKTITYITTMASYDQVDEGVFTSPAPYSQPPVVTSTVTEDDGSSKTVVISYFPSEGEDGVTRTGITTASTILLDGGQASHSSQAIFDGYQSSDTRSSLRNSTKLSDVPSKSVILNTPHGSTHLTAESAPTGGITNSSESLLSPSIPSSIKSDKSISLSITSTSITPTFITTTTVDMPHGSSSETATTSASSPYTSSRNESIPSITENIAEGAGETIHVSLPVGMLSLVALIFISIAAV
ncbi:Hypothetical protein J6888_04708 [Nakaseomyces glabratus]